MAKKYLNAEGSSLDFPIIFGKKPSATAGSYQQFLCSKWSRIMTEEEG